MKHARRWFIVFLMIALGLSLGCAKKTIRSDAVYTPSRTPTAAEAKPEGAPEAKPESGAESAAAADREKKLQEENLREQALREQALREKAQQEEASRKETAAREAAATAKLEPVYFAFDQWSIQDDQKELMVKNSDWLKSHPRVNVRAEGHCDERGTSEYNLALGQKRAEAAKAFLEGLGISGKRISAVSYGKERPLDPGHNESAWAKNRRVDFVPAK